MLNTIRADFYRLFHSKGFYITQAVLFAVVALSTITEALGSVGAKTEASESLQDGFHHMVWTGSNTLMAMSSMASFLLYFCLPLLVITVGFDLTRKTYKNLLTAGVSRFGFFISKYLLFLIMSLMQFVIYYGVSFIIASIKSGVGDIDGDFVKNFFQAFGMQFIFLQAIFILAVVAVNLVHSNVAAVLTVVVVPLIIAMIALVLSKQEWLQYFNFQGNIDAAWMTGAPKGYWLKAVGASAATIAAGLVCSFEIFRKQDL